MNSFLSEKFSSIIMIILGIIALLFPMISTETIGFISGIVIILLAAAFIVAGIAELIITKYFGLIYLIFAVLCMIFAYYLIFNPTFVSGVIGLMIYLFGIMLVVLGILLFFTGPIGIVGIVTILYGFLTLILGYFLNDPKILGTVIGIWLLIAGIMSLFTGKDKDYVDV